MRICRRAMALLWLYASAECCNLVDGKVGDAYKALGPSRWGPVASSHQFLHVRRTVTRFRKRSRKHRIFFQFLLPSVRMKTEVFCLLICLGAVAALTRKQEAAEQSRRKVASPASQKKQPQTESEEQEEYEEEEELSDLCPEPNGYFPDAEQCDKYHDCRDGKSNEKLCPDGLVFNDFSPQHEKCDLPFGIDCAKRLKFQKPQPSPHCPRMHGYFAHEDPRICNTFYYCVEGKFNMITCPDGLVFSEKTGICNWPDEAQKKGCGSRELFNFTCPKVDDATAATHPRYPDTEDCQYFYVCVNGETPRRSGCKLGQAFDERTGKCDWARRIPECKEWYKGQLTDQELDALENPPPKPKPTGGPSRRKRPKTT